MYFIYSIHPKAGNSTTKKRTSPNPNSSGSRLCLTFEYTQMKLPIRSNSSRFPTIRFTTHFQPSRSPKKIRLRIPKVRSHQEDTVRLLISEITKTTSGITRSIDNHLTISPSRFRAVFYPDLSPRHCRFHPCRNPRQRQPAPCSPSHLQR